MSCLNLEHIYLFLERELSPEQNRNIEEHLTGCPRCQEAVEERRRFLLAAESLPDVDLPPGFTQQVMEKIFSPKVSFSSWMAAFGTWLVSVLLMMTILLLPGSSVTGVFVTYIHSFWTYAKSLTVLSLKIFTLITLSLKLVGQLSASLLKALSLATAVIGPEAYAIGTTLTLLVLTLLFFIAKRKLLAGEKL